MSRKKFENFEERWNELLEQFPKRQALLLRLRRAISWWRRTEQMKEEDIKGEGKDNDARFIFLWVGFNALYARDPKNFSKKETRPSEREAFERCFKRFMDLGSKERERIYNVIKNGIKKEIDKLLENKFVSAAFWEYHHGVPNKERWDKWLDRECREFNSYMDKKDVYTNKEDMLEVLLLIFSRLYVLRNQMMHGGATWDGRLNYRQLREGVKIMSGLLPVFIDIMLEYPEQDWGEAFYPRVEGKPLLPLPIPADK